MGQGVEEHPHVLEDEGPAAGRLFLGLFGGEEGVYVGVGLGDVEALVADGGESGALFLRRAETEKRPAVPLRQAFVAQGGQYVRRQL